MNATLIKLRRQALADALAEGAPDVHVASGCRNYLFAYHGGPVRAAVAILRQVARSRLDRWRLYLHQHLSRLGLHSEAGCGVCEPLGREGGRVARWPDKRG